MEVARQRTDWPEKAARELRWCSIGEALELVENTGLRQLITRFAKDAARDSRRFAAA
jgi:hypothetical protein